MSLLEVHNSSLKDLVAQDAALERIAGGLTFTEGPLWRGDHLLFSDIPNKRIARLYHSPEGPVLTTFSTGCSNGLTADLQGRVLAAEHDGRRVSSIAEDGSRTMVVERYQGKRLNSPNDIVVRSDGAVFFTDPPYGLQAGPDADFSGNWWERQLPGKEQPCNGVYRLDTNGSLELLAEDFALPNGLAFSPDEKVLYVDDSDRKHIRAFNVRSDGSLDEGRILLDMASPDPNVPDGLKVDVNGNIFCTGPGGVWICRSDGELLGRIMMPEMPANLAWGGDGGALYITARTSVYRLQTLTRGELPVFAPQ